MLDAASWLPVFRAGLQLYCIAQESCEIFFGCFDLPLRYAVGLPLSGHRVEWCMIRIKPKQTKTGHTVRESTASVSKRGRMLADYGGEAERWSWEVTREEWFIVTATRPQRDPSS